MRALSYLIRTRLKNQILSLKKKPAMLILYTIIAAFCVFSFLILFLSDSSKKPSFGDERVLFLILFSLGMLFLYIYVNSGVSTGSSLFTMPDVGLLFVAPISSKKILVYGLINTFAKSMLGSIFIFYQIGNLKTNFNYGIYEIIILFIVFTLMVLFGQLLAIGIYILTNGNPFRKKVILGLVYLLIIIILLSVFLIQQKEQKGLINAALTMIDTKWFGYIPLAGWTTMLFIGCVHYQLSSVIIAAALFLISSGLILILLTSGKADYYEDVLVSTETTFQTLNAAKEGRKLQNSVAKKVKIKDSDLGLKKGRGAYTIFYKHLLEMRRKSKLIFIDSYTLLLMLAAGVFGNYFRKLQLPIQSLYVVLCIAVYLQFIFSMMGRLKNELLKPYLFMIPEKSIVKVLAASLTSIVKQAVDGAAIFLTFTVVSQCVSAHSLLAAIAYTASGTVFVALTILYQRVLGGQPNRFVQMFISIGLLAVIMGPAIGLSIITAFLLPGALQFLCTLPFTIFCLIITFIIFITCGNLLDQTEFTGKI
jgi:hypothetical protein